MDSCGIRDDEGWTFTESYKRRLKLPPASIGDTDEIPPADGTDSNTLQPPLSSKSRSILAAIAEGHSYAQIVAAEPGRTYPDIFNAAAEALAIAESPAQTYQERLDEIRRRYPRAYEEWTDEEDARLFQLFRSGKGPKQISETLQRQPSAICSRLTKLNLTTPD